MSEKIQEEANYAAFIAERAQKHVELRGRVLDRRVVAQAARDFVFAENVEQAIKRSLKLAKADPTVKVKKPNKPVSRLLTLLWSDWHIGSDMFRPNDSYDYGAVEEARRIGRLCEQAANYKLQYRSETSLRINFIGDIVEGRLHDLRSGADLNIQFARAFHHITQALRFLAVQFPQGVIVECQRGNHGRFKDRHPGHATSGKSDSFEDCIYQALKTYCNDYLPNVKVNIENNAYSIYDVFGHRCMTTHGDTIMTPGNVGKNIPVGKISDLTNAWNARPGEKRLELFTVGHVHFPTYMHLQNGSAFFTNGALVPPNGYAESLGIPVSTCAQWMWESTPSHLIGDARLVVLDQATDKDSSLDKIIRPWKP